MFFAFLLFHPDIFAWSNIMNGKDTLVLFLHVLLLWSVSLYFRGRMVVGLGLAFFVCLILFNLRFYVPILFGSAFGLSLFLTQKNYRRPLPLFVGFIALFALGLVNDFHLQESLTSFQEEFINPFYGFIHFMLTPIPFGTSIEYSFLDIPALIHWLLIPFTILGLIIMLKQPSNYTRFFLLYLLVFVVLYACYNQLQGPRHRVQLDFGWALLQFMGIKSFLYWMYPSLPHSRSN